jgi:hypothetical protein
MNCERRRDFEAPAKGTDRRAGGWPTIALTNQYQGIYISMSQMSGRGAHM